MEFGVQEAIVSMPARVEVRCVTQTVPAVSYSLEYKGSSSTLAGIKAFKRCPSTHSTMTQHPFSIIPGPIKGTFLCQALLTVGKQSCVSLYWILIIFIPQKISGRTRQA